MTIILKDVFGFGREQIGMYSLTQVIYPSLDVTFIAILEPTISRPVKEWKCCSLFFCSIFNEWYVAQTSKSPRTVNRLIQRIEILKSEKALSKR